MCRRRQPSWDWAVGGLRADPLWRVADADAQARQVDPSAKCASPRTGWCVAVKHGSVYQRHGRSCPEAIDGVRPAHRCRGNWAYVLEYGRDSTGTRLQTTKAGFPTRAAAQKALQDRVRDLMTDVSAHELTVGEYLQTWLAGKHALRPKTVSLYRDLVRLYLEPHLGGIRLLDLRAQHLDRFYAAIVIGQRGTPLSPPAFVECTPSSCPPSVPP